MRPRQILRCILAWLALWSVCAIATAQSDPFADLFGEPVDASEDDRPGEDDVRLIGLRVGALKLSATVTAYERADGLCIVARELLDALEVPLDWDEGRAEGWFIVPDRTLIIDFNDAIASLGRGGEVDIQPVAETPDGWCIGAEGLSQILPIDFVYRPGTLTLEMEPRETLPLEARLQRAEMRKRLASTGGMVRPDFREIPNPYRWVSFPTADIAMEIGIDDQGISQTGSLDFAGDFLKTTARFRAAPDGEGDIGYNLSFERVFDEPPKGLKPRQLRFGDVTGIDQPLISRAEGGRGLVVTNRPAFVAEIFDITDIRGPLPQGWEAELHRDGQLVAFVTEPNDLGEYAFENVEIRPGYNRFSVKLFGPYGEAETRQVKVFAGNEMRPENEVQYSFSLVQEGIGVDGRRIGAVNTAAAASLAYGLSRQISARLDTRVSEDDGVGASASVFAARGETYGVLRVGRTSAHPIILQGGLVHLFRDNSSIDLRFTDFAPSVEPSEDSAGSIRRSAFLGYDTVLPVTRWGLPFRGRISWDDLSGGVHRVSSSGRVSGSFKGWRWNQSSAWALDRHAEGDWSQGVEGELSLARSVAGFRLRAGLGYGVYPKAQLSTLDLTAQKQFAGFGVTQFGLSRDMQSDATRATFGVSRDFNRLNVSAVGAADDAGGWSVGVRFATALFFDKRRSKPAFARPGLSRSGAIQGRVFDDLDGDGLFGPDDQTISGASFILDQSVRKEATGSSGDVVLTDVQAHRSVNLELQLASLEDPFLMPLEPGLSMRLRPGQVIPADFPLSLTGEADAIIRLQQGDTEAVPVAGVRIEAVDSHGRVIGSALSEYDGYVYLGELPMGAITLRVSPEALSDIGASGDEVSLILTRDNASSLGLELTIRR